MSLKQSKNLYRELASSKFTSNFKNIRKPETYECSNKRCKICQYYLNETKTFTMSNDQNWRNCREIDCHSVNVIYYLICIMCNKKEVYIGKVGHNTKGFKVIINQEHICKTGVSILSSHVMYAIVVLKLVSAIFYQIFIFSPNYSLLKTMKNVFYLI